MTMPTEPSPPTPGTARAVLRVATDIHRAQLGPNHATFPLTGEDTGGVFSLTDFTMAPPPAPGPPPHIHEDADEAVYVLEGTIEMGVEDAVMTGSAGSVMLAPRGSVHSLSNGGTEAARFIVVLTPPGFEGFWREIAELQAHLGGPPDAETVVALQRKYHMTTGGEVRRFE